MFANIHKKCSTGPQFIYFVKVLFNSLSQHYVFNGNATVLFVYRVLCCFENENGFGNLEPRFVDQEVEVQQIPAVPDHLLVELSVRTIGSRQRIRSAASHWLDNQVFLFLILMKLCLEQKQRY